jgi:outer membrane receptor protein involved in Fe transport
MKRILIVMFWMVSGFYLLNAQPGNENFSPSDMPKNGVITGKVQDNNSGQFVEYATLSLFRQKDSSLVTGNITDSHGAFSLKELPYGMYYLEAGFIGYKKMRLNKIPITPQKSVVDVGIIKIIPASLEIDAVKVTADIPRVEYKLDKKVITLSQDMTASGGTVAQALENTPSVEVDIEGNVSLRGSSNFKVLIDGKPSVIQGSEALQQMPASSVQSVEIITNPSAKYDPDGDAGIINLVMKKQKQQGVNGVINASIGTKNKYSADFLLNMRREKINFFLGGEYSNQQFHNEGSTDQRVYNTDTTITLSNQNGIFKRNGFSVKAGADYYLTDKSTVTLQGSMGSRTFSRDFDAKYHEYSQPLTSDVYYTEKNLAPHENQYYNVSLDYRKEYENPLHELKASLYFSQAVEIESQQITKLITNSSWQPLIQDPSLNRSKQEVPEKNIRAQIDYVYPIKEDMKLEAGLQSRWDMDKGDYIFENFDPDLGWIYDSTISNTLDYLDAIQSAYGTFTGKVQKFGYQLGLRAEYDNRYINQVTLNEAYRYKKMHFFPSFYITRELPKQMQLQFSYSRRIDRPDERDLNPFKEFMDNQNVHMGNPGLKPEFTNSFELNYQIPFKKNFISLETYYRYTTNVISHWTIYDSINKVFIHTNRNEDNEFSAGAELMANMYLTPWWQLNLSGNLFRYSLTGDVDNISVTKNTVSWGTNANMVFRLKWDSRIQLMGMYRGPSVTLQGERKGFFFANIAVRKDFFSKKFSVTLNVRDVLRTAKHSSTSAGSNFYTFQEFRREAPVIMLSLSYRINNYKQTKRTGNGEESGEMDFDSGM